MFLSTAKRTIDFLSTSQYWTIEAFVAESDIFAFPLFQHRTSRVPRNSGVSTAPHLLLGRVYSSR
jgi:hypothetical protein